jgi:hypothetical protein
MVSVKSWKLPRLEIRGQPILLLDPYSMIIYAFDHSRFDIRDFTRVA